MLVESIFILSLLLNYAQSISLSASLRKQLILHDNCPEAKLAEWYDQVSRAPYRRILTTENEFDCVDNGIFANCGNRETFCEDMGRELSTIRANLELYRKEIPTIKSNLEKAKTLVAQMDPKSSEAGCLTRQLESRNRELFALVKASKMLSTQEPRAVAYFKSALAACARATSYEDVDTMDIFFHRETDWVDALACDTIRVVVSTAADTVDVAVKILSGGSLAAVAAVLKPLKEEMKTFQGFKKVMQTEITDEVTVGDLFDELLKLIGKVLGGLISQTIEEVFNLLRRILKIVVGKTGSLSEKKEIGVQIQAAVEDFVDVTGIEVNDDSVADYSDKIVDLLLEAAGLILDLSSGDFASVLTDLFLPLFMCNYLPFCRGDEDCDDAFLVKLYAMFFGSDIPEGVSTYIDIPTAKYGLYYMYVAHRGEDVTFPGGKHYLILRTNNYVNGTKRSYLTEIQSAPTSYKLPCLGDYCEMAYVPVLFKLSRYERSSSSNSEIFVSPDILHSVVQDASTGFALKIYGRSLKDRLSTTALSNVPAKDIVTFTGGGEKLSYKNDTCLSLPVSSFENPGNLSLFYTKGYEASSCDFLFYSASQPKASVVLTQPGILRDMVFSPSGDFTVGITGDFDLELRVNTGTSKGWCTLEKYEVDYYFSDADKCELRFTDDGNLVYYCDGKEIHETGKKFSKNKPHTMMLNDQGDVYVMNNKNETVMYLFEGNADRTCE